MIRRWLILGARVLLLLLNGLTTIVGLVTVLLCLLAVKADEWCDRMDSRLSEREAA